MSRTRRKHTLLGNGKGEVEDFMADILIIRDMYFPISEKRHIRQGPHPAHRIKRLAPNPPALPADEATPLRRGPPLCAAGVAPALTGLEVERIATVPILIGRACLHRARWPLHVERDPSHEGFPAHHLQRAAHEAWEPSRGGIAAGEGLLVPDVRDAVTPGSAAPRLPSAPLSLHPGGSIRSPGIIPLRSPPAPPS